MPITEADVAKIAQLAHLELEDHELKTFTPQMAQIVAYIEQLNELDTSNVAPATGGFTPEGETTRNDRGDEIQPPLGQSRALDQAPDAHSGHFRVPKIL